MDNNMIRLKDISPIATLILGIVLGLVVYGFFLQPEVETKVVIKETFATDTVYVTKKDTVYLDKTKISHEFIRDTVLLEGWKPKINRFRAVFPHTYGNAYLSGEVLGEVLNTELTNDFRLPVITNTITKEKNTTNTIIQRGLFVGGGFANTMDYSLGAAYLGNGFLVNVDYTPNHKFMEQSLVQANIKINPFRIKKRN